MKKCKFNVKDNRFEILIVLSPIFVEETHLQFRSSFKGTLIKCRNENLAIHSSSYKKGTTQIAHHNTFHRFRHAHFKYPGCLFINNLAPRTGQSLTSINFPQDYTLKIIQNLNPNKPHGQDKISISMIRICGKSLCKLLEMIFKSCIIKGKYPSE